MNTLYRPFLKLDVLHDYYKSGQTSDFSFIPLPTTKKIIAGHKMLLSPDSSPFQLSIAMNGNKPLVKLGKKEKLTFLVYLKNSNFRNFTDLQALETKSHVHYFSQDKKKKKIQKETISIKPSLFSFQYESRKKELSVEVENDSGAPIFKDKTYKNKRIFTAYIDLQGQQQGKYTLKMISNKKKQFSEDFYLLDLTSSIKPFGLLEFTLKKNYNFSKTTEFQLNFTRKQIPWKYLITLAKDYKGYKIDLRDTKSEDPDDESPYPVAEFDEKSGITNLTKGTTLEYWSKKPGSSEILMLPFLQVPNKDLQLRISKENKVKVVENLPNPSPSNIKAEVHLKI